MDSDQLKTLLKIYELGECTREEIALIESWYNTESAVKSGKVSMEHLSKANANIWGKVMAHTNLQSVVTAKADDDDGIDH